MDFIAQQLSSAKRTSRVVILDQPGAFQVSQRYHFFQRLWDWCHIFYDHDYIQGNKHTIDYLKRVFGERKIEAIDKKFNLHLDYKYDRGLPVLVSDIEKIFAAAALIYQPELEQFFHEVKRAEGSCRHLDADQVGEFKEKFQENFQDLTNSQLKDLYRQMIPFDRIETIFLNHAPKGRFGNSSNPKKNFSDFQKFVFSYEEMRRRGLIGEDKKKYRLFHQIRMMKKLMNVHNDLDLIFETPKGLLYHFETVERGGAFVAALKAIKPDPSVKMHSALYFLPTQGLNEVAQPWESLVDDLRIEIGSWGAEAIMKRKIPDLLLESRGFIGRDEKIEIYGYSLGGNQAARCACALYPQGIIRKLYVTSNPAFDEDTANYFRELVLQHRHKMKIVYSSEQDDHTVRYGAVQLGTGALAELVKIRYQVLEKTKAAQWKEYQTEDLDQFPLRQVCVSSSLAQMGNLVNSMNQPHTREYKTEKVAVHILRNYSKDRQDVDQKMIQFLNFKLDNRGYGYEESRLNLLSRIYRFFDRWRKSQRQFVEFLREKAPLQVPQSA